MIQSPSNDTDLYKKQIVEAFKVFHKFCIENNLKYSLHVGTLLGCVRHNGFIPWDDDFDVIMPREDAMKFIQRFNESDYIVRCQHDEKYYYPFCKLFSKNYPVIEKGRKGECWFWIDIFYADRIKITSKFVRSNNRLSRRLLVLGQDKPNLTVKYKKNKILHRIKDIAEWLFLHIFFSFKRQCKKYDKLISNHTSADCEYIQTAWSPKIEKWPTLQFDNLLIKKFEGVDAYIFADYDRVLKSIYGNYMEYPPESERKPKHGYILL